MPPKASKRAAEQTQPQTPSKQAKGNGDEDEDEDELKILSSQTRHTKSPAAHHLEEPDPTHAALLANVFSLATKFSGFREALFAVVVKLQAGSLKKKGTALTLPMLKAALLSSSLTRLFMQGTAQFDKKSSR